MNKVELRDIAGGALQEKFEKSFVRIVENLQDPNTSFKVKRRITITMDFVQNEKRDDVSVGVNVVEKLAPQEPMSTAFQIGKNLRTGELYAEEYGKQIRGQMSFDEVPQPAEESKGEADVVSEQQPEKVLDLRKMKA